MTSGAVSPVMMAQILSFVPGAGEDPLPSRAIYERAELWTIIHVRNCLYALVEEGRIEQVGGGKKTRYRRAQEAA